MVQAQDNSAEQQLPGKPMRFSTILERLLLLNLSNRFVWLTIVLAALLLLQLSLLQRHSLRFDTIVLVAILMVVIESAAAISLMLMLGATPRTRVAWNSREPGSAFNQTANVLSAMLICVMSALLLLAPLLVAHQYPELVAQGLRIPLTMLQRASIILGTALIAGNLTCIYRFHFRLPWRVAAAAGLISHIVLGYLITAGSARYELLHRLNDVFFYNQLWQYFDWIPNLQRPQVFHNMEPTHTALYIISAAAIWLVTFLLWLPRAVWESSRNTRDNA